MKYRHVPIIATLSLLVGCGDKSPTDVNAGIVSGTVSFTYTGAAGGSFSATGGISSIASAAAHTTTWATGWNDNSLSTTNIVANVPRAGGLADFAVIIINSLTTGTNNVDANCSSDALSCNMVVLAMGATSAGSMPSTQCFLESGTITISAISSTNATGSFSGAGSCFSLGGAGIPTDFVVTNGSFNVPLQAIAPL